MAFARKVRLINRVDALDKLMRHYGQYERDNKQKADVIQQFMEAVSGKSRGLPTPLNSSK